MGNFLKRPEQEEGWERSKPKNTPVDYDKYDMPFRLKLMNIAIAATAVFVLGYIFYHSIIVSMLLCPFSLLYPSLKAKEIISRRKDELNLQFKDMLYALSASLSAGRSVELAFKDVLRDLAVIYPNPDAYILVEVERIIRRLEMNETVESALADFAGRSHLEDVKNFVDVFHTCKRSGGNIIEVIRNTSNIITDKIEIRQEIDIMLAQRRLEHRILNFLPIIMILLLTASSEDYMKPVFTEAPGRLAMTFALLLLAAAYLISRKIMHIKV